MTNITPLPGQSIFDIALMTYGIAEAAYDIALANDIDITDDVEGKLLDIPNGVKNKKVTEYYAINSITPATFFESPLVDLRIFDETFDKTFN
jgi:hypothetical protein